MPFSLQADIDFPRLSVGSPMQSIYPFNPYYYPVPAMPASYYYYYYTFAPPLFSPSPIPLIAPTASSEQPSPLAPAKPSDTNVKKRAPPDSPPTMSARRSKRSKPLIGPPGLDLSSLSRQRLSFFRLSTPRVCQLSSTSAVKFLQHELLIIKNLSYNSSALPLRLNRPFYTIRVFCVSNPSSSSRHTESFSPRHGHYYFSALDVFELLTGNATNTANITKRYTENEFIKVFKVSRRVTRQGRPAKSSAILLSPSGIKRARLLAVHSAMQTQVCALLRGYEQRAVVGQGYAFASAEWKAEMHLAGIECFDKQPGQANPIEKVVDSFLCRSAERTNALVVCGCLRKPATEMMQLLNGGFRIMLHFISHPAIFVIVHSCVNSLPPALTARAAGERAVTAIAQPVMEANRLIDQSYYSIRKVYHDPRCGLQFYGG